MVSAQPRRGRRRSPRCPYDCRCTTGRLSDLHVFFGCGAGRGLIGGSRDASGLLYRRNRYLDPKSGRFTQEDPIGLAGGLNAYGFASGDPISYSDPYGLCDDPARPECRSWAQQLKGAVDEWTATLVNVVTGWVKTATEALTPGPMLHRVVTGEDPWTSAKVGWAGRGGELGLAALALTPGGQIGRGLRGASRGLAGLFAEGGGLADNTVIGIRSTLVGAGFRMSISQNRKGYLFTNALGEGVRVMQGSSGWYLRIRNAAGNYLDVMGNPNGQAATHIPIRNH